MKRIAVRTHLLCVLIGLLSNIGFTGAAPSVLASASRPLGQWSYQGVPATDVQNVAFSPDGKTLITVGYGQQIRLWDTQRGQLLRIYGDATQNTPGQIQLGYTPDEQFFLAGAALWNIQNGLKILTWNDAFGAILSADGHSILIWKVVANQCEANWQDIESKNTSPGFSLGESYCPDLVAASPDGKYLVIGTQGGADALRLLDARNGRAIRSFVGPDQVNAVADVSFSSDSHLLLAGGTTTNVWDVESGGLKGSLQLHAAATGWLPNAAFSKDGQTIVTTGDKVELWSVHDLGAPVKTLVTTSSTDLGYSRAIFSPDGTQVVLLHAQQQWTQAEFWNIQSGQPEFLLHDVSPGHIDSVYDAAYSPDGRYIATGAMDGVARLWNARTGQLLRELVGHQDRVTHVAFSPDSRTLMTASWDLTARLWDIQTGNPLRVLEIGNAADYPMQSIAFSPDGASVVAGTGDGLLMLWSVHSIGAPHTYQFDRLSPISNLQFSHDGRTIFIIQRGWGSFVIDANTGEFLHSFDCAGGAFAVSPDGKEGFCVLPENVPQTSYLLDLATDQQIRAFRGAGSTAAFSPDGNYVVSAGSTLSGWINPVMWDVQTGQVVQTFVGQNSGVTNAIFSPDGHSLLTASMDGTARLWDVKTGKAIRVFATHSNYVYSAVWSPDSQCILVGGIDNAARLVSKQAATQGVLNRQILRTFTGHTAPVLSVAYSHSGKTILTGSADKTARLWDAMSGQTLRTFSGHTGGVRSVAYSPDDQWIVTGSDDGTARLWNAQTGQQTRVFAGHTDVIWSVAYSNNGQYLAIGSQDGLARLWNVQTGTIVHTFIGHLGAVLSVSISPDNKTLLTGGADGEAYLWDIDTGWQIHDSSLEGVPSEVPIWSTGFTPDSAMPWAVGLDRILWWGWSPYVSPYVTSVAYSPDGRQILGVTRDGHIAIISRDQG